MRKFLLKISIFVLYALFLQVIIPIWVDPFNVFHAGHIRANGIDLNKNYVKMKHILTSINEFDSFMFGSSRVGMIYTDKISSEKCYNMTCHSGLPGWHLINIKTFMKNNIHPRKIYIGVDSRSYTDNRDYEIQINDPMRCPYEYLANDIWHFMKLYLDPAMILRSLDEMVLGDWPSRKEVFDAEIFYKYGYGIGYAINHKYDWSKATPSVGEKMYIDLTLRFIRETVDICRKNGIELTLFTNPMHRITYLASVNDKDYLKFLEDIVEISDFWNFSSLNDITLDNNKYLDSSHYKSEVGDLIIDIMCNGKSYPELQRQGFGVKVTRENAKDFISMLKKQAEEYEKLHH